MTVAIIETTQSLTSMARFVRMHGFEAEIHGVEGQLWGYMLYSHGDEDSVELELITPKTGATPKWSDVRDWLGY